MYERILVPLDGSPVAEAVLPHVEALAKAFHSQVVLLQTIPSESQIVAQTVSPELPEMSLEIAHEEREALLSSGDRYLSAVEARFKTSGIDTATEVADGTPAHAILEVAKSRDISLIAMSTHGRSGFGRAVFGSVSDAIIRNSHLPVLLIRPDDNHRKS